MLLLHEFLCSAEKIGGDIAEALDILLGELQMWKRRTALYQKKKQFIRRESTLAVILAGVMCYISHLLIPYNFLPELTASLFYQVFTAVTLSGLLCIEVIIFYKLTGSWGRSGLKNSFAPSISSCDVGDWYGHRHENRQDTGKCVKTFRFKKADGKETGGSCSFRDWRGQIGRAHV